MKEHKWKETGTGLLHEAEELLRHPAEPPWQAIVAMVATSTVSFALPNSLRLGSVWLEPGVTALFLVPSLVSAGLSKPKLLRLFGYINSSIISAFLIFSVFQLVRTLPSHAETAGQLLKSAGALWLSNVLVFAVWYWRLDGGGPLERGMRRDGIPGHLHSAFFFPQMQMDREMLATTGYSNWEPKFIDYLFLAFNTSTALSPADTAALSRWSKVLMMLQAMISLVIIVLLAARAINIL